MYVVYLSSTLPLQCVTRCISFKQNHVLEFTTASMADAEEKAKAEKLAAAKKRVRTT